MFQFVELRSPNVPDDSIARGVIKFGVPRNWLADHGKAGRDLVVLRFDGAGWVPLPAEEIGETSGEILFRAISPGFALIAIGIETPAQGQAAPTLTPTVPSTQPTHDPAITLPTTVPVRIASPKTTVNTPPPTPTPVPIPPPLSQPVFGIPLMFILGCLVGIAALGGAGFLIRRWWRHRQNPALFRNYD